MKTFNEFLSSLDLDYFAALSRKTAHSAIEKVGEVNINTLPGIIHETNVTFSIELLRKYHEWLAQCLEQ